jgi:hypothetical protein
MIELACNGGNIRRSFIGLCSPPKQRYSVYHLKRSTLLRSDLRRTFHELRPHHQELRDNAKDIQMYTESEEKAVKGAVA